MSKNTKSQKTHNKISQEAKIDQSENKNITQPHSGNGNDYSFTKKNQKKIEKREMVFRNDLKTEKEKDKFLKKKNQRKKGNEKEKEKEKETIKQNQENSQGGVSDNMIEAETEKENNYKKEKVSNLKSSKYWNHPNQNTIKVIKFSIKQDSPSIFAQAFNPNESPIEDIMCFNSNIGFCELNNYF
ncbi:hypothetical protein M0813_00155 [Anaeramoeba flamelloides]|uniref:Uncharacterized protein n=1 Tax=Anaeramoeba flamelloides TaxID=1746091 RepID=A0ABQ8YX15_9EUKA|nr:hypothetical protein M0813_00155 [Anaeramoeba flamelloides]